MLQSCLLTRQRENQVGNIRGAEAAGVVVSRFRRKTGPVETILPDRDVVEVGRADRVQRGVEIAERVSRGLIGQRSNSCPLRGAFAGAAEKVEALLGRWQKAKEHQNAGIDTRVVTDVRRGPLGVAGNSLLERRS